MWKTACKKLEMIWSAYADHITLNFSKAVFHKFYKIHKFHTFLKAAFHNFYLAHSWIPSPRWSFLPLNWICVSISIPKIEFQHFVELYIYSKEFFLCYKPLTILAKMLHRKCLKENSITSSIEIFLRIIYNKKINCNWTRTRNHLNHGVIILNSMLKQTLNHLAKLV